HMADQYDYSYESGKSEILSYFNDSFKPTVEIIAKRQSFFDGLKTIEGVFVLGHSLSPVDQPYITKIIDSINNPDVKWTVTYYSNEEHDAHKAKLLSMGLNESQI